MLNRFLSFGTEAKEDQQSLNVYTALNLNVQRSVFNFLIGNFTSVFVNRPH